MKLDLHLHTSASDGQFTPTEIIHLATTYGLSIIAITDHDTIDGIPEALAVAQKYPLKVIPAVEINTDIPNGEVHILGYFIDYTDRKLRDTLDRLRNSRRKRAQKMINRLHALGMDIEWQRVKELAQGDTIGRPHIAQALLEKGYINSIREAFIKYIGRNGPAYVEREKILPTEAVELIIKAKGLPILAHPANIENLENVLQELKKAGLVGLEVYYDGYSSDEIARLSEMAKKHGLITSGGSDYHGLDDASETKIGGIDIPLESVRNLLSLAERSLGIKEALC